MAKGGYIGVDGTSRKVKKAYIGVDGAARKVKKAYIGVNGIAKLIYLLQQWEQANTIITHGTIIGEGSSGVEIKTNGLYFIGDAWWSSATQNSMITAYNGIKILVPVGTYNIKAQIDYDYASNTASSRNAITIGRCNSNNEFSEFYSQSQSGNTSKTDQNYETNVNTTSEHPYICIYAVGRSEQSGIETRMQILLKSLLINNEEMINL